MTDSTEAPTASSSSADAWRPILIAAGVIVAAAVIGYRTGLMPHLGGTTNRSSQIATSINASSCSRTDYFITNKLDGSKTTIYDCVMGDGFTEKCVTEEGGLVHDQTATVKLLFANTLGGASRPTCAT